VGGVGTGDQRKGYLGTSYTRGAWPINSHLLKERPKGLKTERHEKTERAVKNKRNSLPLTCT